MAAVRLTTRAIDKIWGRRALGFGFADAASDGEPIGEIWFETQDGETPELLIKYLFTSAKLSVQVHPDDDQAQARGHRCGKEECWLILDADLGATIGIGLKDPTDSESLRSAALDGSIEQMLDWKPVEAGDLFYLPAGTIHAIGPGVTLLEVQQNIDLTYRLYDYGRPRDLHLDDAVAVAVLDRWTAPDAPGEITPGRTILAAGRKLVLEQWVGVCTGTLSQPASGPIWLIPLEGSGSIDGDPLEPGGVWLSSGQSSIDYSGRLLMAYSGSDFSINLLQAA